MQKRRKGCFAKSKRKRKLLGRKKQNMPMIQAKGIALKPQCIWCGCDMTNKKNRGYYECPECGRRVDFEGELLDSNGKKQNESPVNN
jgi:hypothetical protein